MRKVLNPFVMLTTSLFFSLVSFAQNVTINYQTYTPPGICDEFNDPTNVPATIDGSTGTIQHQTRIGDVKYSTSQECILLDCNYVSASDVRGTNYRIAYNFKVAHKYIITVTTAELSNTSGTPYGPYLKLQMTNNTGGGGTTCVGTGTVDPGLGGTPSPVKLAGTGFADKQFAFATPLTASFSTIELTAIPAVDGGVNSVKIRKIVIAETPPPATFTLTPTPFTLNCGTTTARTFTVNNVYNSPGTFTYEWSLGASNGWVYNGSAAPTTPFIAGNSITLTTASSATPSNVTVNIKQNGNTIQTKTSTPTVTLLDMMGLGISITGAACAGYADLDLTGYPTGASVVWSSSNSAIASPGLDQINSSLGYSGNGSVTITGTVSAPCYNQATVSTTITVETANVFGTIYPHTPGTEQSCYSTYAFYTFQALNAANANLSGDWGYRLQGSPVETIVATGTSTPVFYFDAAGSYEMFLRPTTPNCGPGAEITKTITVSDFCSGYTMVVSPNPAKDEVNVELSGYKEAKTKELKKFSVKLLDINTGQMVKQWNIPAQKQFKLSLIGVKKGKYVLNIDDGERKTSKLMIVE